MEDSIKIDDLDLFTLTFKEWTTIHLRKLYLDEIRFYLYLLGIKSIRHEIKHNTNNIMEILLDTRGDISLHKIQITEKNILDLSKAIKSCLINDSAKIFDYIISHVIPTYDKYFCFCHESEFEELNNFDELLYFIKQDTKKKSIKNLLYPDYQQYIEYVSVFDKEDIEFYLDAFMKNKCDVQNIKNRIKDLNSCIEFYFIVVDKLNCSFDIKKSMFTLMYKFLLNSDNKEHLNELLEDLLFKDLVSKYLISE